MPFSLVLAQLVATTWRCRFVGLLLGAIIYTKPWRVGRGLMAELWNLYVPWVCVNDVGW